MASDWFWKGTCRGGCFLVSALLTSYLVKYPKENWITVESAWYVFLIYGLSLYGWGRAEKEA